MFSYDNIVFDYDPFPIGIAKPAFSEADYKAMVEAFPKREDLEARGDLGVKFLLSRSTRRRHYKDYVRSHEVWRQFSDYITGQRFIDDTLGMLEEHNLSLGKTIRKRSLPTRVRRGVSDLLRGRPPRHTPILRSRFDFSAMPATGGCIRPHTDTPTKIITLVIPIIGEEGWNPEYGGGTSVVWPKDRTRSFNYVNQMIDFDEVENVRTYEFQPNQVLLFIKTFNSWHAVWPMTGNDPSVLRKTLTINIEAF